jgi:hypothetical protein
MGAPAHVRRPRPFSANRLCRCPATRLGVQVVTQCDNMAKPEDQGSLRLFCSRVRLLQKAFTVIPAKAGIQVLGGFLDPVPRSARDGPG